MGAAAVAASSYPLLSPTTSSRSPLDLGFYGGGGGGELLRGMAGQSEVEKPVVVELAVAAMGELLRMAQLNEPLWVPHDTMNAAAGGACGETLNEEEYARAFSRGFGLKQFALKTEASRETAVVIMNQMNLVEMLMDVVTPQLRTHPHLSQLHENIYKLIENLWSRINGPICSRGSCRELSRWKCYPPESPAITMELCKW